MSMDEKPYSDKGSIYIPVLIEIPWDEVDEAISKDVSMIRYADDGRYGEYEIEADPDDFKNCMYESVDLDAAAKVMSEFIDSGDFYELPVYQQMIDALAETFDEEAFDRCVIEHDEEVRGYIEAVECGWAEHCRL